MLDVWPNCFLSHLPRSLFVSVFVKWLKYPVIGALGFYLDILLDAGWCMVTRWQGKICKVFYGLSSLMQSNAFKTYLIYVLTVIYSCLCLIKKLRKKEKKEKKGWKKERQNWTGLMPGSHGLRHFTSCSWLPSKPFYSKAVWFWRNFVLQDPALCYWRNFMSP